jgi:hypothetical protein
MVCRADGASVPSITTQALGKHKPPIAPPRHHHELRLTSATPHKRAMGLERELDLAVSVCLSGGRRR